MLVEEMCSYCQAIFEYMRACAHLFALPEHQVHGATDESHGEADPGQDVGGAKGTVLKTGYMKARMLSRVDGYCDHQTQRGQQLNYSGENESLSLFEPEELKYKDDEANTT